MEDFVHYNELIKDVFKLGEHLGKYDFNQMMIDCNNEFERQDIYRIYYKHNHDLIMENLRVNKWFNTYGIDWTRYFTPIEYDAWCAIRAHPMVFYPQYPVLNYVLDFGNPLLKVGIELDGKAFHTHEKDLARDLKLHKEGWKIYRITGSEAVRQIQEFDRTNDDDLNYYLNNTAEGIIEAIQTVYGKKKFNDDIDYDYINMCHRALKNHSKI